MTPQEREELQKMLNESHPDSTFEEDWSQLSGPVEPEPEGQFGGILDRVASGVLMGLPTRSRERRGIPVERTTMGDIAEGVGEVGAFFGPAGGPMRAFEGVAAATNIPRIMRSVGGALEGMGIGAIQGVAEGDTNLTGRIMGEGAVGAGIPAVFSGIGALYDAGVRLLTKPKGTMAYRGAKDLITDDPVTHQGLNTRLANLMEEHDIPIVPLSVNKGRWLTNWLGSKVPQMGPSKPHLEKLEMDIDNGFKKWGDQLAKKIAPTNNPLPHGATGEQMVENFDTMLSTTYRQPASKIYDQVTDAMKGYGAPVDNLIMSLKNHLENSGAGADPKTGVAEIPVGKVRSLIKRLETINEQDGLIPFDRLWKEAKDLYPQKKSGWTDADIIQRDAQRIVKSSVRELASKHEEAGELLSKADVLWRKMEEIEDHPTIAKIVRKAKPETLVEGLTSSARTLREAKEILSPEVVKGLIQRRFMTILAESRSDKTGEIVMDTFANKLKNVAGTHGNVENEWLKEAFIDQPEMVEAIDEFLTAMRLYDPARDALRPRYEGFGGGSEVASPGAVLGSYSALVSLLTNFVTGGQLAKHYTAKPKNNPFLGGNLQVQDPKSMQQGIVTALRRAGIASGAGEALGNEISNRLIPGGAPQEPSE